MEHRSVGIYCFDLKDGKTPESRLQEAVKDWIRTAESSEWGLLAAESDGTIIRSSRGKPYLRGCPGLGLSITHSGPFWFCALAEGELGIDLQEHVIRAGESRRQAETRYRKMAVRFFHKREAAYVLEGDSFRRFFRIWAAKEAYVKYTGQGIDDSFGEFCVIPEKWKPESCLPELSDVSRENSDWQREASGKPEEEKARRAPADGQPLTFRRWTAGGVWFAEASVRAEDEYTLCVCCAAPVFPELKWMSGPLRFGAGSAGEERQI